jgi:arylamine N-acetyltransferase
MQTDFTADTLVHPGQFEQEALAFLENFSFNGPHPSLEHIYQLARYFSRLPYENISKILKRDQGHAHLLRLPDELLHDHLRWQLGGTCFSLTYYLCGIFTVMGYQAAPLICDLNWGSRNHAAVKLSFAGQHFLVDPGYMIFAPLILDHRTARSRLSADTGVELRFDETSKRYAVYTLRNGQATRRYQFASHGISYADFARAWLESFDQPGMDDLTLTQVKNGEMLYIQGDFIKFTRPDKVERFREANRAEHLILKLYRELRVLAKEHLDLLTPLTELISVVGVPGTGLLDDPLFDGDIEQAPLA